MRVDEAAANRNVLVRLDLRLRLRLRLRFESLGLRGRSSSVGSALTQVFIPSVPRIVSSVCNGQTVSCMSNKNAFFNRWHKLAEQ